MDSELASDCHCPAETAMYLAVDLTVRMDVDPTERSFSEFLRTCFHWT
jgi:hypothetical protein